ncbi:MAG TPA: ABC transporter permease subunit, partial [Clostridia bacterium]|nr:ABC transporter permease subunit [Clostridia bacterium]
MPHFISTVVMVGMLMQVFNSRVGLFAVLYRAMTGIPDAPDFLAKAGAFPHLYVWSGIWQSTGWGTIIYMAALSAVDPELHEAAVIDGATRWQRVLHVDFPAVLPTVTIMLILRCGQLMGIGFDKVYLLQNNLNLSNSEVIATYVYKVGLAQGSNDFSYATAIGLFNSVINLVMLLVVNAISRLVGETSLW